MRKSTYIITYTYILSYPSTHHSSYIFTLHKNVHVSNEAKSGTHILAETRVSQPTVNSKSWNRITWRENIDYGSFQNYSVSLWFSARKFTKIPMEISDIFRFLFSYHRFFISEGTNNCSTMESSFFLVGRILRELRNNNLHCFFPGLRNSNKVNFVSSIHHRNWENKVAVNYLS